MNNVKEPAARPNSGKIKMNNVKNIENYKVWKSQTLIMLKRQQEDQKL